jgi:hypothetical protein
MSRQQPSSARARARFTPRLEGLEDRKLLATTASLVGTAAAHVAVLSHPVLPAASVPPGHTYAHIVHVRGLRRASAPRPRASTSGPTWPKVLKLEVKEDVTWDYAVRHGPNESNVAHFHATIHEYGSLTRQSGNKRAMNYNDSKSAPGCTVDASFEQQYKYIMILPEIITQHLTAQVHTFTLEGGAGHDSILLDLPGWKQNARVVNGTVGLSIKPPTNIVMQGTNTRTDSLGYPPITSRFGVGLGGTGNLFATGTFVWSKGSHSVGFTMSGTRNGSSFLPGFILDQGVGGKGTMRFSINLSGKF